MSYATTIKQNANKEGMKTLLWLLAGALVIMFFTKVVKAFSWFTGLISGASSEKELADKAELQKNEVQGVIQQSGYSQSTLPHGIAYYTNIANSCENYMKGWGTESAKMYNLLKPLTPNELKAVYLQFGSRINEDFQNDAGNLFTWFGWELGDYSPFDFGALSRMRTLWKQTGLPITF